jgi:dihydroorotate dehydrogenase
MSDGYERFVRPFLFSLDPEAAHNLAIAALHAASHVDLALHALNRFAPPPSPKTLFGLTFPNPIGVAAGFDKNGAALPAWAALGFGFIEIGTVTPHAQPGNPKPRISRLPEELALINRLGFNNDGADAMASRLATLRSSGRWPAVPVGINLGKSRDTPPDSAAQDYLYCFQKLQAFADYISLNISSPNTPGLRSLQDRPLLSPLLRAVQQANTSARKPILIKIAPDLSESQLADVIAVCEENQIAGIIATNTTLDHSSIPSGLDENGGLSGAPLREKSTTLVRAIRSRSTIPVIGCGGITDAASAREKFTAGAQLVQVYTGYVFRGPGLLREITKAL